MINLATLPETHPLRNRALKEIDAHCNGKSVKTWKIKDNTYNELAEFWRELNTWIASQ